MNESEMMNFEKVWEHWTTPASGDTTQVWKYLATTQVTPAMVTTNPRAYMEYLTHVCEAMTLVSDRIRDVEAKNRFIQLMLANGVKL